MTIQKKFLDSLVYVRKLNLYIADATDNAATNEKFTSTTVQDYIVPAGKRWFVIGGNINRDASQTVTVDFYDSSDNRILRGDSRGAGTGITEWPSANYDAYFPVPLDAGEYVKLTFGGAQGAAAWATCVVLEVNV